MIPGATFTGKTTLVQALVEAGATYYSDEYAVLDDRGRIQPYPRPLSIRTGDGSTLRERRADLVGRVAFDERARMAAVVITRYRAGVRWQPRRLTHGTGRARAACEHRSGAGPPRGVAADAPPRDRGRDHLRG